MSRGQYQSIIELYNKNFEAARSGVRSLTEGYKGRRFGEETNSRLLLDKT